MLGSQKVSKFTPHLKLIGVLYQLKLSRKKDFDFALEILESQLN